MDLGSGGDRQFFAWKARYSEKAADRRLGRFLIPGKRSPRLVSEQKFVVFYGVAVIIPRMNYRRAGRS